MANDRLWIGNLLTGRCILLSEHLAVAWGAQYDARGLDRFLEVEAYKDFHGNHNKFVLFAECEEAIDLTKEKNDKYWEFFVKNRETNKELWVKGEYPNWETFKDKQNAKKKN